MIRFRTYKMKVNSSIIFKATFFDAKCNLIARYGTYLPIEYPSRMIMPCSNALGVVPYRPTIKFDPLALTFHLIGRYLLGTGDKGREIYKF